VLEGEVNQAKVEYCHKYSEHLVTPVTLILFSASSLTVVDFVLVISVHVLMLTSSVRVRCVADMISTVVGKLTVGSGRPASGKPVKFGASCSAER